MIEALQEEKKLTLKLYTNVRKTSFFDYYDDEKPEDQMHNVDELNRLLEKNKDANLIDIYINSPGGDVSEGITIYNILKRNKAYKSHILTKKSQKRKRGLRKATTLTSADLKRIKAVLSK